jgi:hypothetical protein
VTEHDVPAGHRTPRARARMGRAGVSGGARDRACRAAGRAFEAVCRPEPAAEIALLLGLTRIASSAASALGFGLARRYGSVTSMGFPLDTKYPSHRRHSPSVCAYPLTRAR